MNNRLNKYKYPGAKRLMVEAQELRERTEDYCAQPLEDNLFEWHFTVRGPPDTAFDGGFYHGRLSFPTDYPMKPPSIILLTPNGRFETNMKICLSISGYHPETWQPSWSVRTALLALIAFMPTKAHRAIGSLDYSDTERKELAKKSRNWSCETCGLIRNLLKQPNENTKTNDNICTTQACEPSTSRVKSNNCKHKEEQELANEKGDKKEYSELSNSSSDINKKRNKTSDIEQEDKNTDYQPPFELIPAESPSTSNEFNNPITEIMQRSQNDETLRISGPGNHSSANRKYTRANNTTIHDQNDRRSFYPTLVFKSICILLSLLLLRRAVIVLQS